MDLENNKELRTGAVIVAASGGRQHGDPTDHYYLKKRGSFSHCGDNR